MNVWPVRLLAKVSSFAVNTDITPAFAGKIRVNGSAKKQGVHPELIHW